MEENEENNVSDDSVPHKFPKEMAHEIGDFILKEIFKDFRWDYTKAQNMIQYAAKAISSTLKENLSPNFDFFVQVTLSEKIGQALLTGSMSLWDPSTDDYATSSYDSDEYIVIANIYGVWTNIEEES